MTTNSKHYWVHYNKAEATYTIRIAPSNSAIRNLTFTEQDRDLVLEIARLLNDAYNSGSVRGYQAGFIEAIETYAPPHAHDPSAKIETLNLPNRALNCLKREGINTIIQLVSHTPYDIRRIKNLGDGSFDAITNALALRGLGLRESFNNEQHR